MDERQQSRKLLKAASREVFEGSGFSRPDRSGLEWFEDHGWYVLCSHFLMSSYAPEVWLLVYAHFFWSVRDVSDGYTVTTDYGSKVEWGPKRESRITYTTDDAFYRQAVELAQRGLAEVDRLRGLSDWSTAKQILLHNKWIGLPFPQTVKVHQAKLCIVTGHPSAGRFLNEVLEYRRARGEDASDMSMFLSLLDDLPAAQAEIAETISFNRQAFQKTVLPVLDLDYQLECPPPDPTDKDLPSEPPKRRSLLDRILRRQ